MTSLKAEPAGRVHSLEELFALAQAMERDTAARYAETARQLREQDEAPLSNVFEQLAETERRHSHEIDRWAEHQRVSAMPKLPWAIPDTFDSAPEEMMQTRLLTPYRALASAVRHEQRSFAFWTYVSAHAERGEVKEAAERMAREELEHISLLRRERRKAFHAERREARAGEPLLTPGALALTERRIADLMESDPACAGDLPSALSLAAEARDAAARLEAVHALRHPKFSAPRLPAGRDTDVVALAEYLAEAYLRLADMSRDEQLLGMAQDLAQRAIRRLRVLARKQKAERADAVRDRSGPGADPAHG